MVRTRNKRRTRRVKTRWPIVGILWAGFLLVVAGSALYEGYIGVKASSCVALARNFREYDKLTDELSDLVTTNQPRSEAELEREDTALHAAQAAWEVMKREAEQCLR